MEFRDENDLLVLCLSPNEKGYEAFKKLIQNRDKTEATPIMEKYANFFQLGDLPLPMVVFTGENEIVVVIGKDIRCQLRENVLTDEMLNDMCWVDEEIVLSGECVISDLDYIEQECPSSESSHTYKLENLSFILGIEEENACVWKMGEDYYLSVQNCLLDDFLDRAILFVNATPIWICKDKKWKKIER